MPTSPRPRSRRQPRENAKRTARTSGRLEIAIEAFISSVFLLRRWAFILHMQAADAYHFLHFASS